MTPVSQEHDDAGLSAAIGRWAIQPRVTGQLGAVVLALVGGGWGLVGWWDWLPVPALLSALPRGGFVLLGMAACGVAVAAQWLPRRLVLAVLSAVVALTLAALGLGAAFDEWGWVASEYDEVAERWVPRPYSRAWHRHRPDFAVWYSFDGEGWRHTPSRPSAQGEVWFLGCSYTFGNGVADDECYPAVAIREFWPRRRGRNLGRGGSATRLALKIVGERLTRPGPRPRAVLYGWIFDHARRNLPDGGPPAAVAELGERWTAEPAESGSLPNRGRWRIENDPHSPTSGPLDLSTAVSAQLIGELAGVCRQAEVPFFLLALPSAQEPLVDPVVEFLLANRLVEVVSLRGLTAPELYYPHDTHPRATWHAQIARALGTDPRLAFLAQ